MGGKGGKKSGGGTGPGPLRGLGEGRGSHTWRGPLRAWVLVGWERELQGIGGSEGNMARVSPTALGPREPAGVLGLSSRSRGPSSHMGPRTEHRLHTKAFSGHADPGPKPPLKESSGCMGTGSKPPTPNH